MSSASGARGHEPESLYSASAPASLDERLRSKLMRDLGELVMAALEDATVIEILLNADGSVWLEKLGAAMYEAGRLDPPSAAAAIQTAATIAGLPGNSEAPIVQCTLPFRGERFEGLLPPLVTRPVFSIRKPALQVFTLADLVHQGVLSTTQSRRLAEAITLRQNIVISGGVSTGKTTFCNALVAQVAQSAPDHRLIIIEDTPELQCAAANHVALCSGEAADMRALLRATLRLRPDRILVGEVRGGEALTLLKAWNTGHPGGLATVHANSPDGALIRLDQLASEAAPGPHRDLIVEAVDLVVQLERSQHGRRVQAIHNVLKKESTT